MTFQRILFVVFVESLSFFNDVMQSRRSCCNVSIEHDQAQIFASQCVGLYLFLFLTRTPLCGGQGCLTVTYHFVCGSVNAAPQQDGGELVHLSRFPRLVSQVQSPSPPSPVHHFITIEPREI